jgi:drug/metabolite transporter (DMT)-like permease
MKQKDSTLAWILLIGLALVWGSSFILMKKSLTAFSPQQVASIRIFSAALFFLPVLISKRKSLPLLGEWKYCLLAGLMGNLLPAFLFTWAGSHMSSSLAGVLNAITPLATLVVGALFFGRAITKKQTNGMLVGFVGCIILIFAGNKNTEGFDVSLNPYTLLILVATIMYGFNSNIIKNHLSHIPTLVLTTAILWSVGWIAGIVLLNTDFLAKISDPSTHIPLIYALILGILGTGIATIVFNYILQITSPIFTSSVTYLIPIVAVFWGVVDGEILTLQHTFGMLLILFGIYWVNRK